MHTSSLPNRWKIKTPSLVVSVTHCSRVVLKMKHEKLDIFSKECIQHNIYTIFEKISSFSCFIFSPTRLQWVTLTTREGVFIFHLLGKEDVCIGIGYRNQVFKNSPVVLLWPNMKGLMEYAMYVSQGKTPMSWGDSVYQWICDWILRLPHGLINQYEHKLTRIEASMQIY